MCKIVQIKLTHPEQEWKLDNVTFVKPTNCDVRLRKRVYVLREGDVARRE